MFTLLQLQSHINRLGLFNLTKTINFFKHTSLLVLLLLSSLLLGCNSEEEKKVVISEKKVAISFFNAIYNDKDVNKALSLSSENFKKELEKYHTANNIARRVFNMRFDSVSLHSSAMKTKIISESQIQVTMMVQFTGQRNGKTYKDYKKIRLVKENDKWVMDKILDKD